MEHFLSRWPNATYKQLVTHYGAEPVVVKWPREKRADAFQNEIYRWLDDQKMRGTFIGTLPGCHCWHIEGDSDRLMFRLRWT